MVCPRCPNCTLFATINGVDQCVCCFAVAELKRNAASRK